MTWEHSLMLTPRDDRLLLDCYRSTLLSFPQIKARHFLGVTDGTICNRLRQLNQARLLTKQRLGIQIYQGSPKRIGTVYQIARQGLVYLQSKHPQEIMREDPMPLNTASLSHDLILTDVMTALEKRFPDCRLVNGKLLKGTSELRSRAPDAMIEVLHSGKKWAIELELTAKSNRRYREIIMSYRLHPGFEKVLYIVSSKNIAMKIQTEILGYKVSEAKPVQSTGRFYFGYLSELVQAPKQAPIVSGSDNLITRTGDDSETLRKEVRS